MTRSQQHFEAFQPHSQLKHTVLKNYLEGWARKLLLRNGAGNVVCIVDACAGKGRDGLGAPGSPVVAAEVARAAESQLRAMVGRPIEVHLIAIEKNKKFARELAANLGPYERTEVINGTLGNYIEEHYRRFNLVPALFFIDPFGLEPLEAHVIQRALAGPKNEVLLLFADQAALRHFGAATALAPNLDAEVEARMPAQIDIFSSFEATEQAIRSELEEKTQRKSAGQDSTRPHAIRILNAAFGGEHWRPVIEETPPGSRRGRFIQLAADMLLGFGAVRVLPLPMRNDRDQPVYHLLHATKSPHGYTTMKEAIEWSLRRSPALGEDALDSIRAQLQCDLGAVEALVRREFWGATVGWADNDPKMPSVRRWVLQNTPAYPSHLSELKARLKPDKVRGIKTEMYSFPLALAAPAVLAR